MNKTVTINLSGQVFTIDEDAYEQLKGYLDTLQARFKGTEGADEILSDIESRLAEMFIAALGDRKNVISTAEVDKVTAAMGKPEEFADLDEEETQGQQAKTETNNNTQTATGPKVKRKLYRDPDDKIFGGVLSGLSAYFGIHDPVGLRLATALLFFISAGTVFVLYLILWIIVPKAVTASEKLEMHGEPVNIDNIERKIREEFEEINNRFKSTDKNKLATKARTGLARIVDLFVDLLKLVLGFLRSLVGIILIIIGVVAVGAILSMIFYPSTYIQPNPQIATNLFDTKVHYLQAFVGFSLLIGIPFIGLTIWGFRLLLNLRNRSKAISIGLSVLWIIGLILAIIVTAHTSRSFSYEKELKQQTPIVLPASTTLHLALLKDDHTNDPYKEFFDFGEFNVESGNIYEKGKVKIDVQRSTDSTFSIEKTYFSNGPDREGANNRAGHIAYKLEQRDSTILLSNYLSYPQNDKVRNQSVKITIKVPEGSSIFFEKDVRDLLSDVKNTSDTYDGDMVDHTWTMTPAGLTCIGCADLQKREDFDGQHHRKYEVSDFTKIDVSGVFTVNVHKGSKYLVEVYSEDEKDNKIEVKTTGSTLKIFSDKEYNLFKGSHHQARIDITLPVLKAVDISGPTEINVKDFICDDLDISLAGASKANMDIKADKIKLDASGACTVRLSGTAKELNADVTGASTLNGFELQAQEATVDASGASHARVKVLGKLNAEASGASAIEYDGKPTVSSNASGFSSIKPRN